MNVKKYIKEHENFIKDRLNSNDENYDFLELKNIHQQKIKYVQNERIAHLLVTLFFGLYLLIAIGFSAFKSGPEMFFLIILLLILVVFYVFHYFFLENSIHKWYNLTDEIDKKIRKV